MDNLSVDPTHIGQLADGQDESAGAMAGGIADLDGMTHHLKTAQGITGIWWDHGVVCTTGITALCQALEARQAAAGNMEGVSIELAEKLRAAIAAYNWTDEQAGEHLDGQVW